MSKRGAIIVTLATLILFGAAAGADEFTQPFAPGSVWNTPVPEDAGYLPVDGLAGLPVGLSTWLKPDGVSVPVFRAGPNDPLVDVLYHPGAWSGLFEKRWSTTGNDRSIEAEIRAGLQPIFPLDHHPYVSQSATELRIPSQYQKIPRSTSGPVQVRLPPQARPTNNADGHLVVFQPGGRVFEAYAATILSDGTVVALSYNLTESRGDGDGFQNGVTASMIPVYAGLLRQEDLRRGQIAHALKVVAPAALLQPACVYPALSFDRGATREDPPYSGTLPMGTRLALPKDFDLGALGLSTDLGRMIAKAAQGYGLIIVDRGGAGLTLIAEDGLVSDIGWTPDRESDLKRITRHLHRVIGPGFSSGEKRCGE